MAGIRPSYHHINAGGRSCPSLTPSAGWPSRLRTRRLLQSSTHPAWSEVSLTFYVRIHHYFHCHYWSVSSFFNFFTETESSFCSFCVSFAPAGLSAAGPICTGRGGAAGSHSRRRGRSRCGWSGGEMRCCRSRSSPFPLLPLSLLLPLRRSRCCRSTSGRPSRSCDLPITAVARFEATSSGEYFRFLLQL